MEGQRKISPRKVARFATGTLLVIIFMIALVAASRSQAGHTPSGLQVSILNENEHEFIKAGDIETMLARSANNYRNIAISKLDLNKLEKTIESNPWVVNAEVYVDNTRKIQVKVMQRVPVARIFNQNGSSWYMDSTLKMLPLSVSYAYPAPVFTNVPVFNNDSFGKSFKAKIAYLSRIIGSDTFWNAQITQIEVQPDQTFVLTPMMGNQKILFGDTADAKAKLENLFAFYKNVSTKIGWDKYQVLDVRYKGQVVASPAMGYVPPAVPDTADDGIEAPSAAVAHNVATVTKPSAREKPQVSAPAAKASPGNNRVTPLARQPQKVVNARPLQKPSVKSKPEAKKIEKKSAEEGKYLYQGKK